MKIFIEDPSDYDLKGMLWSGAEKALEEIIDADMYDNFVSYIEEMYDDGIGLTELNDILRFDFDQLKKDIGMFDLEDEIDRKAFDKFTDTIINYQKARMITDSDMIGYGEESESDLSDKIAEIDSKLADIENDNFAITDANDMDDLESAKDDLESDFDELRDLLDDYVDDKSKVYKDLYNFDIGRFFYNI
jgi:hypothetical protein